MKKLKLVPIEECSECPYFKTYSTYTIGCELQTNNFQTEKQIHYTKGHYKQAKKELLNTCPLLEMSENEYEQRGG